MGRRRKSQFYESALRNDATFRYYFDRLCDLAISMFDWRGLPDTVDERFLELTLLEDGKAVFFRDEVLGYLTLQCTYDGRLDVYRNPVNIRAYAVNGYNATLDRTNAVVMWNNRIRQPMWLPLQIFALRLYNLDRIIDVNANAQKTPILVKGSETQRLSILNAYKEFDGNAPAIFADDTFNMDGLSVLKTDAPYVGDRLYQLKVEIWNEALTWLGISNVNIQKKARLITDEVARTQGGTVASRYSRLDARKTAAEQINNMFDLNVSVDFREDIETALQPEEGDEDE